MAPWAQRLVIRKKSGNRTGLEITFKERCPTCDKPREEVKATFKKGLTVERDLLPKLRKKLDKCCGKVFAAAERNGVAAMRCPAVCDILRRSATPRGDLQTLKPGDWVGPAPVVCGQIQIKTCASPIAFVRSARCKFATRTTRATIIGCARQFRFLLISLTKSIAHVSNRETRQLRARSVFVRQTQAVDARKEKYVKVSDETKGCIIKTCTARSESFSNGTTLTRGDKAVVSHTAK